MNILGLDPGSAESALVLFEPGKPGRVLDRFYGPNEAIREYLVSFGLDDDPAVVVAEYMRPRGMAMSAESMDTMFELGRMSASWPGEFVKFDRKDVKMTLCHSNRATDANIRQALIDRWGGSAAIKGPQKCPRCKGKGTMGRKRERCPEFTEQDEKYGLFCSGGTPAGPLHGISGDQWSALAIAVAYAELHPEVTG